MTHGLKFRYVFGIPEKRETYFFQYFTIEEIEQGQPIGNLEYKKHYGDKHYEIISRDQFTGLKDKNGEEIYENDKIAKDYRYGVTEIGVIRFMEGGFCVWFDDDPDAWHYLQDAKERHYIIGNTHGVKT